MKWLLLSLAAWFALSVPFGFLAGRWIGRCSGDALARLNEWTRPGPSLVEEIEEWLRERETA